MNIEIRLRRPGSRREGRLICTLHDMWLLATALEDARRDEVGDVYAREFDDKTRTWIEIEPTNTEVL